MKRGFLAAAGRPAKRAAPGRLRAAAAALLAALVLAGCGAQSEEKTVEKALGLELSGVSRVSAYDSHGGFLGDGTSCIALTLEGDGLERQLAADPAWAPLPADETVQTLVWGREEEKISVGPYLTDSDGAPLVPPVERGYYRLIDRQEQTGTPLLERGSFNFTVGVYDADARVLYCCELDT